MKTIGVVGAGTMGSGIAQVAAAAGFSVIMHDLEDRFVQRGLGTIKKNLDRAVEKGKQSREEADALLGRLRGTVRLEELQEAEVVIEAVVENMEVKKELYARLDQICKPEAVLASNTSGLSITEMASVTKRPWQVVGMHFFNPVPVMKLVEVIKGNDTSPETFELVMDLARKLGKEPIAVNEAPLFAVNRILVPMINEAVFVLMEGVASAEDIDRGMVLGCNHPIGPLALADLVGLDVLLAVMETLYRETGDSKYRPCPLLRKLVRAGHLGRKTGRGFYTY
ncbi:MAG: 3-hydroxybutyryl-CoA dehydrogenase [Dethiobacteria bacterium]|nr:3-hydroxybutyryl-CoA dehydrogenase [Bacillota bacterium]HOP69012.1 3-hydroxybutyryl-CoA dehydrogenase [Bacillota bacterium]HPT34071.1 3-hydroxybutyryl-CoA dehydrogenase [Bacillota bacterium]HPZ65215.1 3-hydroxybutyryl-CoA dehydrogenase [Bacillota bacterium]HQD05764.1 3-hydroxybutyryl-CoA dehydrogenase [Bacillota bacterium]